MPATQVFRFAREGAEAVFYPAGPDADVVTGIFIVFSSEAIHSPPQRGGPQAEPFFTLLVSQLTQDVVTFHGVASTGDEIPEDLVQTFTFRGPRTSAEISGTVQVFDEHTLQMHTVTLDLSFHATGRAARGVDNDQVVLPDGSVIASHVAGFHAPAAATGTLTLDGTTYRLAADDADLFWESAGAVSVLPRGGPDGSGAGGPDWFL